MKPCPLFAYGTLMCAEIMATVSGLKPVAAPATLAGYSRYRVRAESYPGIVSDPHGRVQGVLYSAVTAEAWRRLDRFEGEMYERRPVEVRPAHDGIVLAHTYVVTDRYRGQLERHDWDFDDFLEAGKAAFLEEYGGWLQL